MKATSGFIPPSELGYFLKTFGYQNTFDAYIIWFGMENRDEKCRFGFIKNFLEGRNA